MEKDKQRTKTPSGGQSGGVQSGLNLNSIYGNLVQPNLVGNVLQPQFNYGLPSFQPNQFAPLNQNVINPSSSNLIYSNQSVVGLQGNYSLACSSFSSASTINLTSNFQSANLPANLLAHNPVYNPANVYQSQPDYVYTGALPGQPSGIQPLGIQSLGIQPPVIYSSAIQQPGIQPPCISSSNIPSPSIPSPSIGPTFQLNSLMFSSNHEANLALASAAAQRIAYQHELEVDARVQHILRTSPSHLEMLEMNRRRFQKQLDDYNTRQAAKHLQSAEGRSNPVVQNVPNAMASSQPSDNSGQFAIDQRLYLDQNYVTSPANYATSLSNLPNLTTYDHRLGTSVCLGNNPNFDSNTRSAPSAGGPFRSYSSGDRSTATHLPADQPGANPNRTTVNDDQPAFNRQPPNVHRPQSTDKASGHQMPTHPVPTISHRSSNPSSRSILASPLTSPSSRSILAGPLTSPPSGWTPASPLASPASGSNPASPLASPSFGSNPASPLASPSFGSNPTSPFASSSSGSNPASPFAPLSSPGTHEAKHKNIQRSTETKTSSPRITTIKSRPKKFDLVYLKIGKFELNATYRSDKQKKAIPERYAAILTIVFAERIIVYDFSQPVEHRGEQDAGESNGQQPNNDRQAPELAWVSHTMIVPFDTIDSFSVRSDEIRLVVNSRPILLSRAYGGASSSPSERQTNRDPTFGESSNNALHQFRLPTTQASRFKKSLMNFTSEAPTEQRDNRDQPSPGVHSFRDKFRLAVHLDSPEKYAKKLPESKLDGRSWSVEEKVANSSPEDSTKSSDLPSTDRSGDSGNEQKVISNVVQQKAVPLASPTVLQPKALLPDNSIAAQPKADPLANPIVVQPKVLLSDNPIVEPRADLPDNSTVAQRAHLSDSPIVVEPKAPLSDNLIVELTAPFPDNPADANAPPPHSELKRKDIDLPPDQESKRLCSADSMVPKMSPTAEPDSIDLDQSLNSYISIWPESPVLQIKLSDQSSSESPETTESAESEESPIAGDDSPVKEIVGRDSPPVEMPTPGQDSPALSMPIIVQDSSAVGRKDPIKKTVAVQQRPKFGGCVCRTRCSRNDCACFKNGRPCSTEICDCVSCYNPWFLFCVLNIHVGHLKQDRCVMKNILLLDYESLRKLLSSQFYLPCCKMPVNLSSSIPGTVFCSKQSCQKHLRFSWCKKEFVFRQACQHCPQCDTCVDLRRSRCKRCQFEVDA